MSEDAIVSDSEILDGIPVIRGTRVPVYCEGRDPARAHVGGFPHYPGTSSDLAVAYAEANPPKVDFHRAPRGEDPRRVLWTDETPADIRAILRDDIATQR